MAEQTAKDLTTAIDAAKSGDWEVAHTIAQRHEGSSHADWLHAILHKIEGDAANARYWYRRTEHEYETFADATAELEALRTVLEK